MMKRRLFFVLIYGLCIFSLAAQDYPEPPARYLPVNDFAEILSSEERRVINQQLAAYEEAHSTQIAIVTVMSLGGETIEAYANTLFNKWGIGQQGADNGLLLLIAKQDRKMRIEVGYGAEVYVTDLEAARIIDELLTPHFKRREFGKGIELALGALLEELGVADFEPLLSKVVQEEEAWSVVESMRRSMYWVWGILILGAILQGLIGYRLVRKIDDGAYVIFISLLFLVLGIVILAIASESRAELPRIYMPIGLCGLCIFLYLLVLLPKSVGNFVRKLLEWGLNLLISMFFSIFIAGVVAIFIENSWVTCSVFSISTLVFFYLIITGKIDFSSSGGGSGSSSYSSGGSSYSYSDYSSSYSDYSSSYSDSSWGGGSSGGGGASGSW